MVRTKKYKTVTLIQRLALSPRSESRVFFELSDYEGGGCQFVSVSLHDSGICA